MAFRVNTNVSSLNTQRWLGISGGNQAKALERLSSGYKINKASDDAAGIAIATKLNVKAVSMDKAIDNGNQALAMLQTAEGGIDQISNILTRLKEIATQAASDNTTTRTALDEERNNLEDEIDKIAQNTKYGSTQVLQGSTTFNAGGASASIAVAYGISAMDVGSANTGGSKSFTVSVSAAVGGNVTVTMLSLNSAGGLVTETVAVTGMSGTMATGQASFAAAGIKVTVTNAAVAIASAGFSVTTGSSSFNYQMGDTNDTYNQVSASIKNFTSTSTDVINITSGDISNVTNAKAYMTKVDSAIDNLTTERGKLGAAMNMISYHVANLDTMNENTKASVSTIKDADFAREMAEFTKNQILQQSGVAMLAQANSIPQQVLSLLKG